MNHERKNVEAAVWLNTLTGGSPIGMVDCLLNLVVAEEKATTEQAERKALEIVKMFKVILDFDISKLKYKNGDDFLKNASERIMFGAFATDLPHQIKSYRKLVELGKLKDPVNPKLINEVEARADLIATTMTRTRYKLGIMAHEKYALTDKDFADEISGENLDKLTVEAHNKADDPEESEEAREKARKDVEYYGGVKVLRDFDKLTEKTDRFERGDAPNSLLVEYRKQTNTKHPVPADYTEDSGQFAEEGIQSIERDGIAHFRMSMDHRLERHGQKVHSDVSRAAYTSEATRQVARMR